MKIIVISGSHSNCGKTTIVKKICEIFENSFPIKLGTGEYKKSKNILLLKKGISINEILKYVPENTEFLILESNDIIQTINPDLNIFVRGDDEREKENSKETICKADLISGSSASCPLAFLIANRLGVEKIKIGKLLNCLGIKITECQLGLFNKK